MSATLPIAYAYMDSANMTEVPNLTRDLPLEFRKLQPSMVPPLTEFFHSLAHGPDHAFFHPHPLTGEEAQRLCSYAGRDLYFVAVTGTEVFAYGLLRGWDEGFAIPSLGIAVHPDMRGQGLARTFMGFLHIAAKLRGATRVRLTVYRENQVALDWYRRLGYKFETKNSRELIGLLAL